MVLTVGVDGGGAPRGRGEGGDAAGAVESGGDDGAGCARASASRLDGDPGTVTCFFVL